MYFPDPADATVFMINFNALPSLSFADSNLGAQSSDSPESFSVINTGNTDLSIKVPSSGNNPNITAGYSLDAATTCPQLGTASSAGTVPAGSTCTYAVDFTPTAVGLDAGTLILSDNNLNVLTSTQSISLAGTGDLVATTTAASSATTGYSPNIHAVTLSAAMTSDDGGVDAGTVTFTVLQGITVIGSATTSSTVNRGMASVSYSLPAGTPAGVYTIEAVYNAGGSFATSSDESQTLTVTKAAQAIDFTAPATPVTYSPGLVIPLHATGGASGDTIVFTLDGSSTGTGTITSNSLTVTGAGTLVIDANQTGNGNYSAATQVHVTVVVNKAAQTIDFTAPTTPVTFTTGLVIPLHATGGASGNTILFSLDASSTGTGTITSNSLTVTGAGILVIDANQAGNGNYSAATQAQVTVVVNKTTQTIHFTAPASPVTYSPGLVISLHATVGASGNAIVFSLDASSTGMGTIASNSLTVTGAGTLVIDANETGSGNYAAATQAQVTVVVNKAAQTISFAAPASPVTYGISPITLVAAGGSSGNTVTFSVTGPASVSGSTLIIIGAGAVSITANQAGNANYAAATGVVQTILVKQATSATSLSSNFNPLLDTNPTTFTASVTSTAGTPTGTVSFLDGTTPLGNGTLSDGVATLTVSSLAAGANIITAAYGGDTNFAASTSGTLTESVVGFSLSTSTSGGAGASQTVAPGGVATYTLEIVPAIGTSLPTLSTLTLTGMPAGATATVTPSTWTRLSGTSWSLPATTTLAPVKLAIQVSAETAALERGNLPNGALPGILLGVLLLPLAGRMRKGRKRLGRMLSVLLLMAVGVAVIAGLSGCGSTSGFFGQQKQTYTMTETVTSGALSHSTTLTLTVQ